MGNKERHAHRNGKRGEHIRRDYGSQLKGLEKEPSDIVCQKNDFHSPAIEVLTVIQADDKCKSERICRFIDKFESVLLRASK